MTFVLNTVLPMIAGFLAFIGVIYSLAVLVPGWAITARRLHDTNRSGWMQLLALIPLVGVIIVIILCALPSTPGANRFGE